MCDEDNLQFSLSSDVREIAHEPSLSAREAAQEHQGPVPGDGRWRKQDVLEHDQPCRNGGRRSGQAGKARALQKIGNFKLRHYQI
jgi:hypothetical protein